MCKFLFKIFYGFLFIVFVFSCTKREDGWNIDTLIPLMDTKLNLQNIFEDSLLKTEDSDLLNLVYNNEILNLKIADDFIIPDTLIEESNTGPVFELTWDKSNPLISDTNRFKFNLNNANLTQAKILSGKITFKITSTIEEPTVVTFFMTSATKNGKPLQLTQIAPTGSPSNPTDLLRSIDLSGYTLDLRGTKQDDYNTLFSYFTVQFANPTTPKTTYQYNSDDIVTIQNEIKDIELSYAKGIFSTTYERETESEADFDAFKQITSGNFNVKQADVNFEFINYIGSDFQGLVNQITAINTYTQKTATLQGDFINQAINLSRAKEDYSLFSSPLIPSNTVYNLNEENSNITDFIGLLPNKIDYDIGFTINPLGNVSGGNDFLFSDFGIKVRLNIQIPLNIKANNLTLIDTVAFNFGNPDEGADLIEGGFVRIHTENSYPFSALIQLYTLDQNNIIIDSLVLPNSIIDAGIVVEGKVTSPTKSILSMPINKTKTDLIYKAKRAIVKLVFNTSDQEFKDIYSTYQTKIKVVGDFQYRVVPK